MKMPLESLPAAAREEISIVYEFSSPGLSQSLAKRPAGCESEPEIRIRTKAACGDPASPK
jgi:hypothetical protein